MKSDTAPSQHSRFKRRRRSLEFGVRRPIGHCHSRALRGNPRAAHTPLPISLKGSLTSSCSPRSITGYGTEQPKRAKGRRPDHTTSCCVSTASGTLHKRLGGSVLNHLSACMAELKVCYDAQYPDIRSGLKVCGTRIAGFARLISTASLDRSINLDTRLSSDRTVSPVQGAPNSRPYKEVLSPGKQSGA